MTMNVIAYGTNMIWRGQNFHFTRMQTRIFCTIKTKLSTSYSLHISKNSIASFLDYCSGVHILRKLHARIFVCGLENCNYVGSKLLQCYARLSLLAESRCVFQRIISTDHSLWNSLLVGYYRAGNYEEVLIRYLDLKQQKIGLSDSTINVSLKSCIDLGRFYFGTEIHVDAFKFNLNADCFVGSSLIKLYSKNGKMDDATKVFDEITNGDLVVYTSIITAYAQFNHCADKAFQIAYSMQKKKLQPNRVTLVSLLQAAIQLGALLEGRAVHGYAIRKGIGMSDEIFETSLMDMYHKCGDSQMASLIFDKMDVRTVGSWNTMIVVYLQMGQALKAFHLFFQMMRQNIFPDLLTLANAILSCAYLNYLHQGKSIHGYMICMGVHPDLVASTALVCLYSKFDVTKAKKMFKSLGNKDAVVYNVMMDGFLNNDLYLEAINVFCEMVKMSVKPNVGSYLNVLSAISYLRDFRHAKSIHGYLLRHEFLINLEIVNQIIYTYAKCGYMFYAEKVFNRKKYKDLVSCTSMMMGYIWCGQHHEAIVLFRLMQKENLNLDSVTLVSLLQALSFLGCVGSIKEVHCFIYKGLLGRELSVINSLITAYAKGGRIDLARHLFEQMTDRCLTSWNAMIAAYGMHGNCIEVLKLFEQMKSEKVTPDEVTFTSILTACSHSGLVEEGLQVYRTMVEEYTIVPCEVHYSCIVDLLSRAGKLKEAYNLVKSLSLTKNSSAMCALLSACRLYADSEIERGKWDEVAQIRAMTKDIGMKRTPGYSLIQLDK
ncbi:putative pentatricopeptide repeat-containing protein [Senna tora]|uniref:Putative pentatricopeptide repeat-containing protein n=1 Tax=Senna tora TaxID=362788 RepID=A0A834WX31_9FABA|nr:putative pentatricopeptide repeat-containing protein [Senna tora]